MNEENKTEEVFQCVCGKQFKTGRALGSHKSQCKIYKESVKDQKLKEIQEKESRRLSNGMFKCEYCDKEHDGSYGNSRFCNRVCKDKFIGRLNTTNKSPKVKAHRTEYGTWKCPFCGKEFDKSQQIGGHIVNCKQHPNKKFYDECHKKAGKTFSENCKINLYSNGWLGRKHSIETREKLSEQTKNRIYDANHTYCRPDVKYYTTYNILNEEFIVRGKWEYNVAQILNKHKLIWTNKQYLKYKTDIFRTYHPDFYIPSLNAYIEVKGFYTDDDKLKMKAVLDYNTNILIYFISNVNNVYKNFISEKIFLNDSMLMQNFV